MGKSVISDVLGDEYKKERTAWQLRNCTKPRREEQVQRGEKLFLSNLLPISITVVQPPLTRFTLGQHQHRQPKIKLVMKRSGYRQTRPILKLSITVCRWQCIAPRKDRLRSVSVTCVINQRCYLIMRQHASLKGLMQFDSTISGQNPAVGIHTRSPKLLADRDQQDFQNLKHPASLPTLTEAACQNSTIGSAADLFEQLNWKSLKTQERNFLISEALDRETEEAVDGSCEFKSHLIHQ